MRAVATARSAALSLPRLRGAWPLAGLSDEHLVAVAAAFETVALPEASVLFSSDAPCGELLMVVCGSVQLTQELHTFSTVDGWPVLQEVRVLCGSEQHACGPTAPAAAKRRPPALQVSTVLGPGHTMGETVLTGLTGLLEPRPVGAVTQTDCVLLSLSSDAFDRLGRSAPAAVAAVRALAQERAAATQPEALARNWLLAPLAAPADWAGRREGAALTRIVSRTTSTLTDAARARRG